MKTKRNLFLDSREEEIVLYIINIFRNNEKLQ